MLIVEAYFQPRSLGEVGYESEIAYRLCADG